MVLLSKHDMLNFEEQAGRFCEKGIFTPGTGNYTKWKLGLNRAFLGKSHSVIMLFSTQIYSFRRGTHQFFLIYGQLAFILHYRIHGFLTHKILNEEIISKFSFFVRAMKTELFANIWKETLAPFTLFWLSPCKCLYCRK